MYENGYESVVDVLMLRRVWDFVKDLWCFFGENN